MSKKRHSRKKQEKKQQNRLVIGVALLVLFVLIAAVWVINRSGGLGSIAFRDIHGISFTPDDELYVATHDGLRVYGDEWAVPDVPVNDYMGYSGTQDGFFSSGHPGPQSPLINPLGLIHSTDFGASINTINFSGESDFHAMSASYRGDTVYVFNVMPNSVMSTGLYYSLDGGQIWEASAASGLTSNPMSIAVHPDEPNIVAIATQNGMYLSTDFGATFQMIDDAPATAAEFDTQDGDKLYFGSQSLYNYSLADNTTTTLSIPSITGDERLLYIAISPREGYVAIATNQRNIYRSSGTGWMQIVTQASSS
ncbi:MAG: hypothetical protein Q9P44_01010 [Anaerolineae bacterium]|nr:hypothetical protein [Anaerolineae bacterium]